MKKVEPLDDRVLIKPLDALAKTKGGIILPDQAREKPSEGTIISIGPGKRGANGELIPPRIKEGDTVIYSKYAGTEIKINNVDHVLLRESDCIARTSEVMVEAAASA
jgi:chaperonin GroES